MKSFLQDREFTDDELIDALEMEIAENGPCTLWDGEGEFPKRPRGLSFGKTRTLREALRFIAVARIDGAGRRALAGERPHETGPAAAGGSPKKESQVTPEQKMCEDAVRLLKTELAASQAREAEARKYLDAIAEALHPHKPKDGGWTYIPDQLARMIEKMRERAAKEPKSLAELIEAVKRIPITPEMRRAHTISIAYGNAKIDNPNVTREDFERAYDAIERAAEPQACGQQSASGSVCIRPKGHAGLHGDTNNSGTVLDKEWAAEPPPEHSDTKRLDWLEHNSASINGSPGRVPSVFIRGQQYRVNLRVAIDTAMQAAPPSTHD